MSKKCSSEGCGNKVGTIKKKRDDRAVKHPLCPSCMAEKMKAHAVEPGETNSNGKLHDLHYDACMKGQCFSIREVVASLQPGKKARELAIAEARAAKNSATEDYC